MKFVVLILLTTFISLSVFGFFAMDFMGHETAHACWTTTAQGAPCADFNPFNIIAFHAQAFRAFGMATFVSALLLLVFFIVCFFTLVRLFVSCRTLGDRRRMVIVPAHLFFTRFYFSLCEHSPTA